MDKTKQYLSILVNEMHSVVCATLDDQNRPATRVIDIMLTDGHTLYFLTAKGKDFYKQLITHPFIALTGMSAERDGSYACDDAEEIHFNPRLG
jgi:uncharacterized pyridoxamine 5'-phosphate oxidase family protein